MLRVSRTNPVFKWYRFVQGRRIGIFKFGRYRIEKEISQTCSPPFLRDDHRDVAGEKRQRPAQRAGRFPFITNLF
jgi:hypothetical protein